MYHVRIEQFEGPLDLLLEIIESKKLSPLELPLASIAEQFIAYLNTLDERDPEELAGFIVLATRLALLKSRELVPSADMHDEAEGNLDTLRQQLALYHPFRQAAKKLARRASRGATLYTREPYAGHARIFYAPQSLTATALRGTLADHLSSVTMPSRIPQARRKISVSLDSCIAALTHAVRTQKQLAFYEFVREKSREEQVVQFLGLLELSRLGKIIPTQNNTFGTIMVSAA